MMKKLNISANDALRLSPSGALYLDWTFTKNAPLPPLHETFSRDWREGWFRLAADKTACNAQVVLQFWQKIAAEYITKLCHVPEGIEFTPLHPPSADLLSEWLLKAPPMNGGEYLSPKQLTEMWNQLNMWVETAAQKYESIHQLLQIEAPKWQQVGRVCFHLAENKNNLERPFAFLATYSTGFSSTGKLKHLPLKKSLEQYAGESDHQALIKLLTPVQKTAEKCPWVKELINTGEIYQPLAWSTDKAYKLLTTIPELEENGLSVRIPDWWKRRARPKVAVTVEKSSNSILGVNGMLDFNVEIALGDEKLSAAELQKLTSSQKGIAYIRGQWVEVDGVKLQEALDHWHKVQKQTRNGELSFIDGMRLLAGAPSSIQEIDVLEQQRPWLTVSAGDTLSKILRQLRDPSLLPIEKALENLNATLRPYQQEGVNWLVLLSKLGLGACLADDMGLGKTLQILSLLVSEQQRTLKNQPPSLLVVPASLLGNWKLEAARFTPSLKLLFIHPSEIGHQDLSAIEKKPSDQLENIDLVVTTYSMVTRQKWLKEVHWNLLILDEAQAIKNAGTQQTRAVKSLQSNSRIALTGTPIENRLSELWSLFDFLNPGLLGSLTRFQQYIKDLESTPGQFEPLRKLISPYILRRMKTDPKIISDLPDKIETPTYCHLTKPQAKNYQSTVNNLKKNLEIVDPKNRRGLVLQTLLRLKQICNHSSQLCGDGEYTPSESGKFIRLGLICEELAARQEKVLIFTQFKEIIDPLAEYLSTIFGRQGLTLHGGTPIKKRKELVAEFQNESGPPFFILSLKAGGTGLTLTAASHVIHFDRWWNPAVENQATDRAFRIGQKKNVQVHTFITQGTVEETIDKMINSKKNLVHQVINASDEVSITELSDKELLNLIALDIDKAQMI